MATSARFVDHDGFEMINEGFQDDSCPSTLTSLSKSSQDVVSPSTTLSVRDVIRNDSADTDRQTKTTNGLWTTESSKGLQVEHTDIVPNAVSDQTERRRHRKSKLKKQFVLVGLCCYTMVVSHGYLMSLAVFFLPVKEAFGTNHAETALLQSIAFGSIMCGSALASPLFLKFGAGPVGFSASLLATFGLIASFLAPSFPVLVVTGGLITGVGMCCQYVINFSVVGNVITTVKWRQFAFSVVACSIGIGFSVVPYVTDILLQHYGWRGTMLLLGGTTLNCCPAFLAIDVFSRELAPKKNTNKTLKMKSHWNLSLFKDFGFLAVGFNIFMIMALIPSVNLFLVDISKSKGLDESTGRFFVILSGISSLVGRIFCVALTMISISSTILPIGVMYIATGTSIAMLALANNYASMAAVIPLYNITFGIQAVLFPSAIYEVVGVQRYTSAVGYVGLIGGIAIWISGPIGGLIKDFSGSYDGLVYMAATGCAACAICFFILHVRLRRSQRLNADVEKENVDTYL